MTSWCAESYCWECGRWTRHKPYGGPHVRHFCRLRLFSRARWRGHREGWHEGYRFAVEHPDDPMVARDRHDYGSGWAGAMRAGGLTLPVQCSGEG